MYQIFIDNLLCGAQHKEIGRQKQIRHDLYPIITNNMEGIVVNR